MNDNNEDWWDEDSYWLGSKFEYERNFLLWFGNWFTWFVVDLVILVEAILFVFRFLNHGL